MQGKLFQSCTHLLYCSELSLGGNVITRQMSKPDMGSILHIQNQRNILVIGKLLSTLSKCNAFNLLGYETNTDASILVYKFCPERTGFNMLAEYKQLQLTFLALLPWLWAYLAQLVLVLDQDAVQRHHEQGVLQIVISFESCLWNSLSLLTTMTVPLRINLNGL